MLLRACATAHNDRVSDGYMDSKSPCKNMVPMDHCFYFEGRQKCRPVINKLYYYYKCFHAACAVAKNVIKA